MVKCLLQLVEIFQSNIILLYTCAPQEFSILDHSGNTAYIYIAINSQVHLHETSDSLDIVLIEAPVIKLVSDILSQDGYNISAHVLYYIDIIMSMKP